MMRELDKPRFLRELPKDPEEALFEIIKRIGPLNEFELKVGLKRKFVKTILLKALSDGRIKIVEEEPQPIYGLPEHDKTYVDKGFN